MRVGQTHSLVLMSTIGATVRLGREIFPKCEQELGCCAYSKKPFRLELNSYDMFGLRSMYPSTEMTDQMKLINVLEEVLSEIPSPYAFITILRPNLQELIFFGKVISRQI